jgi:TatD DNase family protein
VTTGEGASDAWLTDTHVHLDMFSAAELPEVLSRAQAAGVNRFVTVAVDLGSAMRALDIARGRDDIRATVGVHPHDAGTVDQALAAKLKKAAADPLVAAIGETGLDYYRMKTPKEQQIIAFRRHLEMAAELDLPVIIHCREAYEDLISILTEAPGVRKLIHCFSGTPAQSGILLKLGCFISFAGTVTFPNAGGLREAAAEVPLERLLLETDAPYLAPQPVRGQRNEPAHLSLTAQTVAQVKGVDYGKLIKSTSINADKLFNWGLNPLL